MSNLHVELYGHLIGHLIGTDSRTFRFQTDPSAFDTFELGSTVLSESVPLVPIQSRSHANRQRNYFAELLPEGRILSNLATRIRASENDVIKLLISYGRDIAGAIQIYDPAIPGEPRTPHTTAISNAEMEALLLDTTVEPLGNKLVSGKSSLAGVQNKIVVAKIDKTWHQVHDGYPSTHIIKPESQEYPTTIFDEEYGCRIARSLGLAQHATSISFFNSVAALIIERYDRLPDMPQGRLHQEDMNQALGARKDEKYQEIGGKISLRRIANLFSKNGDNESLLKLLQLNTLSVAIGNLDMHAKNISLLHYPDGSSTIAPAYDIVPMRHLANDGRIALAVNNKYLHSQISALDITEEAHSWNMRLNVNSLVENTLEAIQAFINKETPEEGAHPSLVENIQEFTQNLLNKKPAGNP